MVLKTRFFFVKKLKISCSSDHTNLFKFRQHVAQFFFNEFLWKDLRIPKTASATVTMKSFNVIFAAKIDDPIEVFYVTIADADSGSVVSPYIPFF